MDSQALISSLRDRISAIETQGHLVETDAEPALEASEDASRVARRRQSAGQRTAFNKLVALVNASDKSEHALRQRLDQAGFESSEIDEAVAKAKDYGLIDDGRFGQLLIRSRIAQGRGWEGIERELRSHRIPPETVEGWPEDFDLSFEGELERAMAMLHAKPPRSKNQREGAYRKVLQRGFSSSVASSAASLWARSLSD